MLATEHYLLVHQYWKPIANACANVSVCLFTILLYHISNTFTPVNADIVYQEKHHTLLKGAVHGPPF